MYAIRSYYVMDFFKGVINRAQQHPQTIVLPEGTEPRTLKAANEVLANKIAKIILLGNPNSRITSYNVCYTKLLRCLYKTFANVY